MYLFLHNTIKELSIVCILIAEFRDYRTCTVQYNCFNYNNVIGTFTNRYYVNITYIAGNAIQILIDAMME